MALKIVRNDITKMNTEAIVNTANEHAVVSTGCDSAVYKVAGYDELLAYRKEKIGFVPEGEAFITPGFNLRAKHIIHAVSPLYMGANIDAIEVAGRFGIGADRAINYECDSAGTALNYQVLSETVSAVRRSKSRQEAAMMMNVCCAPIREDYEKRHKRRKA